MQKFHERCEPDAQMYDLKHLRSYILHEHNKRRNFVASGALPGYYPAARMATMQWDDELEYMATLNLKTCYLEHDDCSNSYRFRNMGQNLCGLYRYQYESDNITDVMSQSMMLWFSEFSAIDSSYITDFRVVGDL